MDSFEKAPPNPPWYVFSTGYNLFLALIALVVLCSGDWVLGIPVVALVAFYFWYDFLLVRNKDEVWPRAQKGDPAAQFELGNLYASGYALKKDYPEALKWYRKAAEQGYTKALDRVSAWYAGGHGTPIDNVEAYFWLLLAKKHGATKTFLDQERVEHHLKPEQIAEVKTRVAVWKPNKEPMCN